MSALFLGVLREVLRSKQVLDVQRLALVQLSARGAMRVNCR